MTAKQEGPTGVTLRFVPEIHHGPIQHGFGAVPNGGSMAPQRFMVKDGQEEETLRELAATLTLQPGQVAVLGCRPDKQRSLGTFLFTQPEVNSDRLLQKVLLIWASRTSQGLPTLEPVDPPDMPQPPDQPAKGREQDQDGEPEGRPACPELTDWGRLATVPETAKQQGATGQWTGEPCRHAGAVATTDRAGSRRPGAGSRTPRTS